MVRAYALLFAVCAACQGGHESGAAGAASGSGEPPRDAGTLDPERDAAPGAADARGDEGEPDLGKSIVDLGAISPWQAVVDRAQLLGRRNQHGTVYGRIGPAVSSSEPAAGAGVALASPYVWLVDDSEGNGSLGIRVALGGKPAELGARVAITGAWQLDKRSEATGGGNPTGSASAPRGIDDTRRWFWKAESIQPLPPAPASDLKDPQPVEPGHAIPNGNLPQGARTISVARDGDAVYFQIVGPAPTNDGDGWLVANELGDTPVALLTLPGERASYGGQDMRGPDERWQLRKAQTYWVRIGKIRKRGPDKPALMHARTGPVRVN